MALDILIVDDEADIRDLIAGVLEDEGYQTRTAGDSDSALAAMSERWPSLLILDIWLQGSRLDGLEVLEEVKQRNPSLPVIIISGHGNIETAVAAIKRGAYDFIEKPFKADQLILTVQRATEIERLKRENEELKERAGIDADLTGASSALNTVRSTLKRVAATGSRVLIEGPPGCGKEVAARLLHQWSTRSDGAFVVVAAARLHPDRFEEELFGSEDEGNPIRIGLFEQAHGGTLFLDEVADMPLTTQAKILRVLTEQVFERVGGSRKVKVDVRVVSATSRDLAQEIAQGKFREDLFYRLNVVPIRLPSLHERREDIRDLADFFLTKLSAERRISTPVISDDAMAALQTYDWPGNIRQLRNVIERTLILAPSDRIGRIEADMLPAEIMAESAKLIPNQAARSIMGTTLREARASFEREYLRAQISRFSGNISRTAVFIGMERSALHRKLKALGLNEPDENEENIEDN